MLYKIIFILFAIYNCTNADLRMASTPKKNFVVINAKNAIPYTENSTAYYMEPSEFNYQGLKNQRLNNYDNFLRSNIDNEQDNRNFENEIGRDMLPFRTFEGKSTDDVVITTNLGKENLIPLRWNNPHVAECEINIWLKSNNYDIVVPLKKPSCCGAGYQDNVISFTIPTDFNQLVTKVPNFSGCNKIGDCVLQIYAHSVEPRTYTIGTPIIITGNFPEPGTYLSPLNNDNIMQSTIDPQNNINTLERDICLPTNDQNSNHIYAIPRFARHISDQFNHAYQNSDFSPYSGQQHELISRNLQAATILRMTAANGGELGKSILNNERKEFINNLINKVNIVVQKYEKEANNIFNMIKNDYSSTDIIGDQRLENCFRCPETGSVNNNRIEQQTYIPSFEIKDFNRANQIRDMLKNNVKNLIPLNSNVVQIYKASLLELSNDFKKAEEMGFIYQPGIIKTNITTMNDATNFLKLDKNGNKDNGVYASNLALKTKLQNINNITNLFNSKNIPTSFQTTNDPNITPDPNTLPPDTLPPNPDNFSRSPNMNFCGKTYLTVDCNRPCQTGLDIDCGEDTCFNVIDKCY